MKTDAFVAMLAAGETDPTRSTVLARYALGAGLGALITTMATLAALGLRPDLTAAIHLPMFWVKLGWAASLAIATFLACLRLARPGLLLGWLPQVVAVAMFVLSIVGLFALGLATPSMREVIVYGKSWSVCPFRIAALSVPVLIGLFWALRGMAPTRPRLAGAASGLLAGAIAAFIYALHCPEMALPFIGFWYPLGVAIPALAGGLLGAYFLHW